MKTLRRQLVLLHGLALVGLGVLGFSAARALTPAEPPTVTWLRAWRADLHAPGRLALGPDGELYVTVPERGEVVVRSRDGRVLERVDGLGRPLGVALDHHGHVLVADVSEGEIRAYDADWAVAHVVGDGAGELVQPGDIAVHPETGEIYVTDAGADRVVVYDADGAWRTSFDGSDAGDGGMLFPTGVAFDLELDELYVVDQGNRLVRVFDLDGAWQRDFGEAGDEAGELYAPQGVWVDQGRVYVADNRLARVAVFDRSGLSLVDIGSYGVQPGQHRVPMDVVVDDDGRLVVSSYGNARLEMWGIDDYDDPEAYLPARATIEPASMNRDAPVEVTVVVEVEGHRYTSLAGLTLAGVAAVEQEPGDADGDHVRDVLATFDGAALAAAVGSLGEHSLTLEGELDGMWISESLSWTLTGPTEDPDTGPDDTATPPDDTGATDGGAEGDGGASDGGVEDGGETDGGDAGMDDPKSEGCGGCTTGGGALPSLAALLWLGLAAGFRRRCA